MAVHAGRWSLAVWVVAATALAGCAGSRIEHGIYYSPKGYRITIPGADWSIVEGSRADLELRHERAPVGMLVNAACETEASRRSLGVLARQLLVGLRDRVMLEQGEMSLNGRRAQHVLLDARTSDSGKPMRIESYVMKDERCVYDLLYVVPAASFELWRRDFHRFVETFELSEKSK